MRVLPVFRVAPQQFDKEGSALMRKPFALLTATAALLVGTLTLGPAGIAFANDGESAAQTTEPATVVDSSLAEETPSVPPQAENPEVIQQEELPAPPVTPVPEAQLPQVTPEETTPSQEPEQESTPAPAPAEQAADTSAPPAAARQMTAADDAPAAPASKKPTTPKKVWVCKFVGQPGVNERLKSGKNPISVSINSIAQNTWNGTLPGWFSDAHDRSFIIAYDTGGSGPSASDCSEHITPRAPENDAVASVSVTPATCDAPAVLVYETLLHATMSGTPNGTTGPGSYSVTAEAVADHRFADGLATLTLSGELSGKIPTQSSNPSGMCYEAPEPPVKPEAPASKVTYTDWVDSEWVCGDESVSQTRTKTTQPFTVIWQDDEWKIIEDTENISTTTESKTRSLTDDEAELCEETPEPPVKPETLSGSIITEGTPVCTVGGGTVVITTTPWTQDWTLDESSNLYVLSEKVYGESAESYRKATSAECPVVILPPVTPPFVDTPVVYVPTDVTPPLPQIQTSAAASGQLAVTGESSTSTLLAAGISLVALGGLLVVSIRRRRVAQ